MKELISLVSEAITRELDPDRFLILGTAYLRHTAFLYEPGSGEPSVIVRIPGHDDSVARCVAEHGGLRVFSELSLETIRAPEVLGTCIHNGRECYVQGFEPSDQWMSKLPFFGSSPTKSHLRKATDHLIELFHASAQLAPEDPLCSVHCFQHRDFWLGNIGWHGKTMVLYDFEYARPKGYPLCDLLHFISYYRVVLRNRRLVKQNVAAGEYDRSQEDRVFSLTAKDIDIVFTQPGTFRARVVEAITRYCKGCNLGADAAHRLVVDFVEHQVDNGRGVSGLQPNWHRPISDEIRKQLER